MLARGGKSDGQRDYSNPDGLDLSCNCCSPLLVNAGYFGPDWAMMIVQGAVAFISVDGPRRPPGLPPSRRGRISGFSAASRRRLALLLRRIRWNRRGVLFVTLTYRNIPDSRVVKQDLNRFLSWLRFRFPGVAYVWKLEFQKRGAPHFHLILDWPVGKGRLPWIDKEMLARAWGLGFVDIKFVPFGPGLLRYVTKYVLKPEGTSAGGGPCVSGGSAGACGVEGGLDLENISQSGGFIGRFWGASRNWIFAPLCPVSSLGPDKVSVVRAAVSGFLAWLGQQDLVWGGVYKVFLPDFLT